MERGKGNGLQTPVCRNQQRGDASLLQHRRDDSKQLVIQTPTGRLWIIHLKRLLARQLAIKRAQIIGKSLLRQLHPSTLRLTIQRDQGDVEKGIIAGTADLVTRLCEAHMQDCRVVGGPVETRRQHSRPAHITGRDQGVGRCHQLIGLAAE